MDLSQQDIQGNFEASVDFLRRCLDEPRFLFWLDWVLRLDDPSTHRQTAPEDEALWNLKEWSYLTTSTCLGIGLDASNVAFYHQGVVLTCLLGKLPEQWSSSYLARYQFTSPVLPSEFKFSDDICERVGDVMEALTAVFQKDKPPALSMQNQLKMDHKVADRIDSWLQRSSAQMKFFVKSFPEKVHCAFKENTR